MPRQIVVDIVGDAKKFTKATDDAIKSTGKLSGVLAKVTKQGGIGQAILGGVGLGAGLSVFGAVTKGVGMVTDAIGDSIKAASDQEEAISKVNVVFGEQARAIRSWAQSSATSMGMSETAALATAGTLGNLFDAIGLADDASADMSKTITQLAADLASFNNVPVADAIAALQAGLVGETEPMRRFGANISAARVEAYALAKGMAATKSAITDAMKVQARYEIILADTKNAQGDFARTSDGLANSQKSLDAKMANLSVTMGRMLEGPAKGMVDFLTNIVDAISGPTGANKSLLDLAARVRSVHEAALELARETSWEEWARKVKDVETVFKLFDANADASMVQMHKWVRQLTSGFIATSGVSVGVLSEMAAAIEATGGDLDDFRRTMSVWVTENVKGANFVSGAWTGMAVVAEEAGNDIRRGVVKPVERTTEQLMATMDSVKEPWKEAWQQLAAWAKNPFDPKRFQDYIAGRVRAATRNARESFGAERARWREIARAYRFIAKNNWIDPMTADLRAIMLALRTASGMTRAARERSEALGPSGQTSWLPKRAHGGPVHSGRSYIVGEKGPEVLTMGASSGHVTSNRDARGGGSSYNINVNVAPGGDLVATGKAIVDAIRQYERRSGRVWRSA